MWRTRLVFVAVCVVLATPAAAQFSVQRFVPSPHARDYLTIPSSEVNRHLLPSVQLFANYATNPLVFATANGDQAVVERFLGIDALFSISFFDRIELGAALPFYPLIDGSADKSVLGTTTLRGLSLGDLRFSAKLAIVPHRKKGFGLAADLGLTFPTSRDGSFVGESTVSFVPRLVAEVDVNDYRVALTAGYRLRKNQTLDFLPVNDELLLGLGASMPLVVPGLTLIGELQAASEAAYLFQYENTSYLEGDLAVRYHAPFGLQASLGGGVGFLRGMGCPQVRLFASIGWVPYELVPEDSDHDGLVDDVDRCPAQPEDTDLYQDQDGCPDPDNDNDGHLDAADRCPNRAEDVDHFADSDGCPDDDNDSDGVPDPADGCPDKAEDFDGHADADGCPDPDNDGDTIPDAADKCPADPETTNGYLDDDGCPDTPPTVYLTGDRIVITQKVFFQKGTATILGRSKPVLDDVARIMSEHPEILKISVEGHTSSEGKAKVNKQLSQWRAATIVNYLVKQKVDRKRLQSAGWGSEKPLTALPEKDETEREINRRVEFLILETSR